MASTRLVIMGVSGSGKSVVGSRLAVRLAVPFVDADDLHSEASVAKMTAGIPLGDVDRWSWLQLVGARLAASNNGIVVACSALRRMYRDTIRAAAPDAYFIHLSVERAELERRLRQRRGHYMPASLLTSQLETLETLAPDEAGITVPASVEVERLVDAIVAEIAPRAPETR